MPRLTEMMLLRILIAARFLFCAFRGADQTITIDEAMTFNLFIDGPWSLLYATYDANNHVLYTILAKACTRLFGVSEFALRVPSLFAGLFLMLAVVELLKRASSPWFRTAAFLAIALHPVLLDLSIAARGYSLSIACLLWGMIWALRGHELWASVLFGLAVSANLGVAFPILAFIVCSVVVDATGTNRIRHLLRLTLPALLCFLAICALPLWTAQRESFYAGYDSLRTALDSYVYTSIHARPDDEGLFGTGEAARVIAFGILPLTLAALLMIAWLHRSRKANLLPLATLVVTAFGFVLAHVGLGVAYPADRSCLFFIPLLCVAWAIGFSEVSNRAMQCIQLALCAAMVAQFATQLHGSYFQFWSQEIENRRMVEILRDATKSCPDHSVLVSATFYHQPTLEFYRTQLPLKALQPVEHVEEPQLTGHDFYVLNRPAQESLTGLRILHKNEDAGFVMASSPVAASCIQVR